MSLASPTSWRMVFRAPCPRILHPPPPFGAERSGSDISLPNGACLPASRASLPQSPLASPPADVSSLTDSRSRNCGQGDAKQTKQKGLRYGPLEKNPAEVRVEGEREESITPQSHGTRHLELRTHLEVPASKICFNCRPGWSARRRYHYFKE